MTVGRLYGALVNPDLSLIRIGLSFIMVGLVLVLVDHQLDIYRPRKKHLLILFRLVLLFATIFLAYFIVPILGRVSLILLLNFLR